MNDPRPAPLMSTSTKRGQHPSVETPSVNDANSMIVSLRMDVYSLTRIFLAMHKEGIEPRNMADMMRMTFCGMADQLALSQGQLTKAQIQATIEHAVITNRNSRERAKLQFVADAFNGIVGNALTEVQEAPVVRSVADMSPEYRAMMYRLKQIQNIHKCDFTQANEIYAKEHADEQEASASMDGFNPPVDYIDPRFASSSGEERAQPASSNEEHPLVIPSNDEAYEKMLAEALTKVPERALLTEPQRSDPMKPIDE